MKSIVRYNYRIYPTETQKVFLGHSFGCARYIFNEGICQIKRQMDNKLPPLFASDIIASLPWLKKQEKTAFLKRPSAIVLQQSLMHLDIALKRCFNKDK